MSLCMSVLPYLRKFVKIFLSMCYDSFNMKQRTRSQGEEILVLVQDNIALEVDILS